MSISSLKHLRNFSFYYKNGKSMTKNKSTIFALSSGFGKCGVAVIRVSGPDVKRALAEIGGFKQLPPPRKAKLKKLSDPITKEVLDQGIVLWFPGPNSFTGEDSCEFQIHGGSAVVSSVLQALGKLDNFQPAEPGEFTKRAFYSGKMDLTSIEGLSALIDSETDIQRKQALHQMEGVLYSLYNGWSDKLMKSLAYLEAYIDFDEDQDIDKDVIENINTNITSLIVDIKKHLEDGRRGERIRKGVQMTILGAPNSGKSSLMNILCKRPAAIVSSIPGTTRDLVQTHLDINGYPVNVTDTAGLRVDPADQVEAEGISRAISSAMCSDFILFIFDAVKFVEWAKANGYNLHSSDALRKYLQCSELGILEQIKQCQDLWNYVVNDVKHYSNGKTQGLVLLNKMDLLSSEDNLGFLKEHDCHNFVSGISCKTEEGITDLLERMTNNLETLCGKSGSIYNNPSYSSSRQRHCLEECLASLQQFSELSSKEFPVDLTAETLRRAIDSLGRLTGRISTEQLLDIIFKDFCIGK
ncbi:tRNA modification GTPase GTPBP3, mitochondrial [Halyomorpha halys]|uniref:tRNA modification GTPase GTPBP3, mitochondrial n=1 Tax=Halyomorpha halys TaxID=286706 RepID=UPI0006D51A22|nr:tRNA modification GTPase GTPBP3, mitochondrial [Halyomorpha halys]